MWIWRCPAKPMVSWDHHTKDGAEESVMFHESGYEPMGIWPCSETHEVTDDGVPCHHENCSIPYVRD